MKILTYILFGMFLGACVVGGIFQRYYQIPAPIVKAPETIFKEVEQCNSQGGEFGAYQSSDLFGKNAGKRYTKIYCEGSPIIFEKKIY